MKKELEEKEKLQKMSEEERKKFLEEQKLEDKKHHELNKVSRFLLIKCWKIFCSCILAIFLHFNWKF